MNGIPALLRRLLLCWLTLCVAGAGAAPYALPRPAEAEEIPTQAEEIVAQAATVREAPGKVLRRVLVVDRSGPVSSGRCGFRRLAARAAARPTLRTLEVRHQV
jgi:hypothetical protein